MKKRIASTILAASMAAAMLAAPAAATETESTGSLALAGRTAVFAGGTGNIGRGAAKLMAENGMNVVFETHNPASAEEIIAELADAPGKVAAVSNTLGYDDMFKMIEEEYGSVDVLIISTGDMASAAPLQDLSADELTSRINNKIISAFSRVQAAVPYLEKSEHARVILTSNTGAMDGNSTENILDEICGGGVISMTYAFARDLADEGITVNCIARSGMINDHAAEEGKLDIESYVDQIPAGAAGTSENYGALVMYIVSEQADFITGNVFNLSGGLHIGD